jgi:hypothetical protein
MGWRLPEDLHWCVADGRIVFLDLAADRYFCLSERAEAAFARWAASTPNAEDDERMHVLANQGLLVGDERATSLARRAAIEPACRDFMSGPNASPRLTDVLAAIASQLRSGAMLSLMGLGKAASALQTRSVRRVRANPASADQRLREIVSAFAQSSLILPCVDRCLVRALALHAICCRNGIRALVVFGVRMDPFRAHCWVQLEGEVLIGDFEQVRLFTPLVALG